MISLTSPVETRAHHWPAGLKLAALCAATVTLVAMDSLVFHALAFLSCLALYALPGRTFFVAGVKTLAKLWPFLALLFVWHLVTGEVQEGVMIALRLVTAVGFATLVTMTTRLTDLMGVVRFLARPLERIGLKTAVLELAVALVLRFTPTLVEKGEQLGRAWRARAARAPNWRVALPFTVLAIDDAEHVSDAIKARGGLSPVQRPGSTAQTD